MSNYDLFSTAQVNQYGNHMVMTNVSKPTKVKYLNIDTANCDEYLAAQTIPTSEEYGNATFTITLPERINSVKTMSVCSLEIPMTATVTYNISSALGNNYFKLSEDFGEDGYNEYMVIVPDGNYTFSTLLQAINDITPKPEGIYVRFENSNNRTHIYMPGTINYYNIYFNVNADGTEDKYNFKNKLGWILGFRNTSYRINPSSYEAFSNNNYVGQGIYSENQFSIVNTGNKNFYLAIEEFTKGTQNSFQQLLHSSITNKDLIAKIGCNNTANGDILYANLLNGLLLTDTRNYNGRVDLQRLCVKLLDDKGNPVKLNGANFSFTLKVEHD